MSLPTALHTRRKLQPRASLHNFGIASLTGVNFAYDIGLLVGQDVPSWLLTEQDTIEKLVGAWISP